MKEKEENRKLNNITMPSVEDKKEPLFRALLRTFPGAEISLEAKKKLEHF